MSAGHPWGSIATPHPETAPRDPVCTHLRHLLWVLRLAQGLLITTQVVSKEVAGLRICSLQSPARAALQLLIEGCVHCSALDEAHTEGKGKE